MARPRRVEAGQAICKKMMKPMRSATAGLLTCCAALVITTSAQPVRPDLSTFVFGGFGLDVGNAVTTDWQGNIYVAGNTNSTNLPGTERAFQGARKGAGDAFAAKFDRDGNLLWATYLGGNDRRTTSSRFATRPDDARAIAVDPQGNVYLAGLTGSTDFPIVNAFQAMPQSTAGTDGFLAKLDPTGSQLLFSTYLGTPDAQTTADALAVGPAGEVWVAIKTPSRQFGVTRDLSRDGSGTAVVAKFVNGAAQWQTRLGFGNDSVHGLAVDALGRVHLAMFSANAPCPRRSILSVCPAMAVAQLDVTGSRINFLTSVAGVSEGSTIGDMAVAPDGTIVLAGSAGPDLEVVNAPSPELGGTRDAFFASFTASGVPVVITYVGGPGFDATSAARVATDLTGGVHLAFDSTSTDLPVRRAIVGHHPDGPLFLSEDRGETWEALKGFGGGVTQVAFDQSRGLLYAAGGFLNSGDILQRSRDGGRTWQPLSGMGPFAIDPRNPTTMYYTSGVGELWRSDQDGARLTLLRSAITGAEGFRVISVAVSPFDSSVWVGTGNGLEVSIDGGQTWHHRDSGFPISAVGTIYTPSTIVFDTRRRNRVYVLLSNGVHRSDDHGTTWERILVPTFEFPTAFALDPRSPDIMYVGASNRGLIMTRDGRSWQRILQTGTISDVVVNPVRPHELYVALSLSDTAPGVLRSVDDGRTWEPMGELPKNGRLFVDPANGNRLFAARPIVSTQTYVTRGHRVTQTSSYSTTLASYLRAGVVRDLAATFEGDTIVLTNGGTQQTFSDIQISRIRP